MSVRLNPDQRRGFPPAGERSSSKKRTNNSCYDFRWRTLCHRYFTISTNSFSLSSSLRLAAGAEPMVYGYAIRAFCRAVQQSTGLNRSHTSTVCSASVRTIRRPSGELSDSLSTPAAGLSVPSLVARSGRSQLDGLALTASYLSHSIQNGNVRAALTRHDSSPKRPLPSSGFLSCRWSFG